MPHNGHIKMPSPTIIIIINIIIIIVNVFALGFSGANYLCNLVSLDF